MATTARPVVSAAGDGDSVSCGCNVVSSRCQLSSFPMPLVRGHHDTRRATCALPDAGWTDTAGGAPSLRLEPSQFPQTDPLLHPRHPARALLHTPHLSFLFAPSLAVAGPRGASRHVQPAVSPPCIACSAAYARLAPGSQNPQQATCPTTAILPSHKRHLLVW